MTQQFFKSFAIVVDEEKKTRQLNCFQKLVNAINSKFNRGKKTDSEKFLKQLLSMNLTLGDAVQINDSQFDYSIIRKEQTRRLDEANINKYFLMKDFEKVLELLRLYAEEPVENTVDIEITIEIPKPKKLKKVTTYEKITVLERWVKIGYKMYRRHFNPWTGDSYIVVDGDVYDIKSDRYGREYLA